MAEQIKPNDLIPGTLYTAAINARQSLENCACGPSSPRHSWAENRLMDFNLWASGVGAFAIRTTGLDRRLESTPEIQTVVLSLLETLSALVDSCSALGSSNGEDSDQSDEIRPSTLIDNSLPTSVLSERLELFASWSDGSSVSSEEPLEPVSRMDQAKSDVDAILEQIIRLGVLIRSSGAPSRVTKADAYFDTQNYQQLENEKYPHSAKLPLQDLLALKSHLLSYIFLNPQRFARNQLTQYDLDFRKDLAELSPQRRQILESLLFANLRRRNRFWYARTHAEKLAATQELYFPQQSTTDISKKDVATDSATTLHMKEQPKVGAILNDTETAASEFKLDQNLLKPIDTPKPPMSRVSVSIQGSGWPRPPLLGPGRRTFRCPCCHLTLSEDDAELISWRKHLSADLSPYNCLFPDCPLDTPFFVTRDEWKAHLRLEHPSRVYWECSVCTDAEHTNVHISSQSFIEHISLIHRSVFEQLGPEKLLELCVKTGSVTIQACPLCVAGPQDPDVDPETLLDHIADHMHDFSMQSLPWINRVNLRYPLHLDSRVSDKIETWFSTIASTTSSEDKWTLPPSVKAMNDSRANLQDTSMETLPHSTTHTEASMDDEDYFAESSKEMSHDGTEMSNGTLDEFSGDQYLESNTESVHSLTASGDDVDWEPSEERPEIETMSLPNMAGDHDRKMTSDENDLIVNWPTNPASGTAPEGSQQWDNVSRHPGHYSPRATMANMTLLPTMVPEIMYPVASAGSALYKTTSQRGSSSDERDSFEQAWKKHTESGVTATEPIDVAAERGHAIHDAGASLRHEAQPEQGDKYSVPDESNRPDSPFGSKPGLSYIFRVDEICEAPDATATIDNKGDWVPSILTSDNIAAGGGVSGTWWYCNGSQIYSFPPAQAPTEAQRYKTYSAYYSGGRGFWILDSDALRPRRSSTWQPLRFAHDTSDYSSYLTTAAETGTLACQRADQTWPNMLLPNIYHGSDTPYAQYGSLKGELGIFLALMSLSVKQDFMAQWFPMMFNNSQWYTHVLPHGRQDKRGVVVYIYTCPPSWNAGSTKEILQAYEDGNWFGSRYYH